jgi:hypothetical protein
VDPLSGEHAEPSRQVLRISPVDSVQYVPKLRCGDRNDTTGRWCRPDEHLAIVKLMGIERFKQAFPTVLEDYNVMVHSKSNIIEAIGKTCEAWFKNPTPSEFERLTELFKLARTRVQARPV